MLTRPQLGLTPAESSARQPELPQPPAGAPNVIVILFDDLGFAQLGCFGSAIETPNIDRLAAGGLRYNRFHVTAICSPTRASLLTGRNHHAVGVGFLADIGSAFPGYSGRIPPSAATLPRLLRGAGYNTMAVGKWHLTPRGERSPAGPFDRWPLGLGFERFYGFLQGDTNHWAPNLVADNHYIDPPRSPEDGYHLSEDLADRAIAMLAEQRYGAPGKPSFLYLSLGAMHAPHHVTPEWVEPYRGRFDAGWDRLREETFARQIAAGVVPEGAQLTPRPGWVSAWDDLDPDAQRMHVRQQEVYAGFLAHADAQIGRLLEALEEAGQLDDTIVMLMSDNGASAEGGQHGTSNEHRFTSRMPETVEANLAHHDEWGGFRSYNHYSWAWAWAGNTPFQLWKRYTWLGGTRTPLIVHWPAGIRARGEVRDQFVHAVDVMPTILGACGVEAPEVVDGASQQPFDGASFAASFDDADAPAARQVQYFEMLGSRSIVSGDWKATTNHVSEGVVDEEELMEGSRDFAEDRWALFDLTTDFSEATDVAADHPDVVRRLEQQWLIEAGRNDVMPLSHGLASRLVAMISPQYPIGSRATFRPVDAVITDESLPFLAFGFEISVDVDVEEPASGVVFSLGDWTGGLGLYAIDGALRFTVSSAGDLTTVAAERSLPAGRHRLVARFTPADPTLSLECDDELLGSTAMASAMPLVFQHGGARLRIGHDLGLPVSDDYRPPFPWNGTVHEMTVDASNRPRPSADDVRAALHSD